MLTEKQLDRRLKRISKIMGLRHWDLTIEYKDEPDGEGGAQAAVWTSSDYDTARLQIRTGTDDDQVDYLIMHELVHVWMRDVDQAAFAADEHIPPVAQDFFDARYKHEQERFVDRVARTLFDIDQK